MPAPRLVAKAMTTRIADIEQLAAILVELNAGQRSNTFTAGNTRSLLLERPETYITQFPPGPFTLGNNVNIATLGAWCYVYIGAKLFGPDACELLLDIGAQIEPGAGLNRLYLLGPYADATATTFKVLLPPIVHRYRINVTYQTVLGGLAVGLNVRQLSIAWRSLSERS